MRRLYLFWLYAITLIALSVASVLTMHEEKRILKDSAVHSATLATSIEDPLIRNYASKKYARIRSSVDRLRTKQHIIGLAICDPNQNQAMGFPSEIGIEDLCNKQDKRSKSDLSWITVVKEHESTKRIRYLSHPLIPEGTTSIEDEPSKNIPGLYLIIAQDISYLRAVWIESFLRIFLSTWLGGIAAVLLITAQVRRWAQENLRHFQQALRSVIAGKRPPPMPLLMRDPVSEIPLSKDLDTLAAKILSLEPSTSSTKPQNAEPPWIQSLRDNMKDRNLLVIANREPYIHQYRQDKEIEVIRPASGLVTALEPILRQFGGTWIAHGSGSADLQTANSEGEVSVPPLNPRYTLRRVFLTPDEELGYYYGFSNEGLWPLCHLAHNRPAFRLCDWEYYQAVNQRFCDSVPDSQYSGSSVFLVQDYHFALLPKLIRKKVQNPQTKIGLFWHIPWPNPEAFGICPWNRELLAGMLGSDVIGFHTQYHCNNFLETCNRYLEARIDWEHFSVTMDSHETFVKAFPIGIDPAPVEALDQEQVAALKARYGIKAEIVAVGVDRVDYTKGLVERVEAVERLLEKRPDLIGKFTFVQIGSPSRTHIPAYKALTEQLEAAIQKVNQRFGALIENPGYRPVIFLYGHHEWDEIKYFYQMGDLCLVTSLHDGMNLVAKEYVWCQSPEKGALILSKFTGASRELTEAFIVNPYSIEELADAMIAAVLLPTEERRRRMLAMKDKIESHSAFHWASDLIQALLQKEETPANLPLPQHLLEPGRTNRVNS